MSFVKSRSEFNQMVLEFVYIRTKIKLAVHHLILFVMNAVARCDLSSKLRSTYPYSRAYHINRPTPSRGRYRNTPMVTAFISTYHIPSNVTPHAGTSLTWALSKMYGIRKYRSSRRGVGRSVGIVNSGRSNVCSSVCSLPEISC